MLGERTTTNRTLRAVAAGLLVVAALALLRITAPPALGAALPDLARDAITLSVSVVIESLPFVFLGILVSIAVRLWVPQSFVLRVMPTNPALRRVVISLLGVLLPVCECGNVPLARGLIVKGVSVPEAMTFLISAPILNPITIVTTYQAFGWSDGILVSRIVGAFVIAQLVGFVFSRHSDPEMLLTDRFAAACARGDGDTTGGTTQRVRRGVGIFAEETSAMLPALIVGAGIAGVIQVAVSRDVLTALGAHPLWSVLAMMVLAFVVSICSNVDAFFVLGFAGTVLPGGLVAFLVLGAMIDIKMLALLRTTFTAKALVQLTVLVALGAAALGMVVNHVV